MTKNPHNDQREILMQIPEQLKIDILAHAKQAEPHESCGFVVLVADEMHYIPCQNVAADPNQQFEISPEAFMEAEALGEIVAVVHSHPDTEEEKGLPYLSTHDRACQVQCGLPFWLVYGGNLQIFRPIPPLLKRTFHNQTQDCRVLCLDAYMLVGLDIDQSALRYAFNWFEQGENLYEHYLQQAGFERLPYEAELQLGDIVLVQVGSSVPNHAGIYLGNQMMLHHSVDRLSTRVLYDGFWLEQTHSIWRHKQWLQLNFTAILNDLNLNSL